MMRRYTPAAADAGFHAEISLPGKLMSRRV